MGQENLGSRPRHIASLCKTNLPLKRSFNFSFFVLKYEYVQLERRRKKAETKQRRLEQMAIGTDDQFWLGREEDFPPAFTEILG